MTAPTQAQIEAAAKAILRVQQGHGVAKGSKQLAEAALTAAAQVATVKLWPECEVVAVQVGEPSETVDQLRHSRDYWRACYQSARPKIDEIEADTIERCAQVVEQHHSKNFTDLNAAPFAIAAAIRKLKDSSVDPNIIHPGSDQPGPFPQEEP